MKLAMTAWAVLGLLLAVSAGAQEQQVWSARYPLPPDGSVSVENVQGSIAVEGWDRAEVAVTVVKSSSGEGGHPEDVSVDVEASGRALTLRTVHPRQATEAIRVDYRLRVPRQARLERLRTVEGSITVRDLEGAVDARTLNGNIEQVNLAGSVVARAINGSIALSFRALPDPAAPIYVEAVNGDLYLMLPADANADLHLSTVAGRIEGNYVFSVSEVPGDTSWRARLGRGGVLIHLRTVRGNIRVAEREDLL